METEIIARPAGPYGVTIEKILAPNPSPFLQRTLINRSEAMEKLEGATMTMKYSKVMAEAIKTQRPIELRGTQDPFLKLDEPLEVHYRTVADPKEGVVSKPAVFKMGTVSIFTATTKMSCASFSIPAGPTIAHGTCPAADIFKREKQYAAALKQGDVEQRSVNPKDWICSYCYAGKSNYMHRTSQYQQAGRKVWLRGMLAAHGVKHAAEVMTEALFGHSLNVVKRRSMGENPNYFRIHDSGDLMSPDMYLFWRQVAINLPHIHFWAPTRQWVFPYMTDLFRKSPPPDNFTLRPSALHFNDRSPMIDGMDAGSTAHVKVDPVERGISDWICPAYQHDGKSCAGAGGPKGEKDCRVCWDYPEMRISYKAH